MQYNSYKPNWERATFEKFEECRYNKNIRTWT